MTTAEARALESLGSSNADVYALVERALAGIDHRRALVVDVGCGGGALGRRLLPRFERYVGTDVVRHADFPADLAFIPTDLDTASVPFADGSADVVVCVETIEHVENPRALVRELVRVARPGGWVLFSTPNQLSVASKLCLVARNQFVQFQEGPGLYPAHITALLEVDLRRIAQECGLEDIAVLYTAAGRVPFTGRRWPAWLTSTEGWRGRAFSDNVLLRGRKPTDEQG